MILTCQECETRYLVDPSALAADGKMVRCMKCGHSWIEMPHEDMPRKINVDSESINDGVSTISTPPDSQTGKFESSAKNKRIQQEENIKTDFLESKGLNDSHSIKGAYSLSDIDSKDSSKLMIDILAFVIVIGILGSGYLFRNTLMEMWPPSAKLYEVIGLSQKKEYSLLIDNIQPTAEKDGDKTILVVTGDITNTSEFTQNIPTLHGTILNSELQILFNWEFLPPASMIDPGQTLIFRARLPDPPDGSSDVEVKFIE